MVANATVTVDDIKAAMGNNVYLCDQNKAYYMVAETNNYYWVDFKSVKQPDNIRCLMKSICNIEQNGNDVTIKINDSGYQYIVTFEMVDNKINQFTVESTDNGGYTYIDGVGTYTLFNPGYVVLNGCTDESCYLYLGDGNFARFNKKDSQVAAIEQGSFCGGYGDEWGMGSFNFSSCVAGNIYHINSDEWGYEKWCSKCDKAYLKSTYDLSVSSVGWASLYFNIPLAIPSGVKAYYASSIDGTTVTLTEITDAIPANTGVIIQASEGLVNFPTAVSAAPISGNLFAGVTAETANPGNVYVLSPMTTTDKPMFQNYTGAALGAYKAYLPAAGAGDVLNFVFDEATAINSMDVVTPMSNVRYNLNGQVVGRDYKGIVIVNGKKYINK